MENAYNFHGGQTEVQVYIASDKTDDANLLEVKKEPNS